MRWYVRRCNPSSESHERPCATTPRGSVRSSPAASPRWSASSACGSSRSGRCVRRAPTSTGSPPSGRWDSPRGPGNGHNYVHRHKAYGDGGLRYIREGEGVNETYRNALHILCALYKRREVYLPRNTEVREEIKHT